MGAHTTHVFPSYLPNTSHHICTFPLLVAATSYRPQGKLLSLYRTPTPESLRLLEVGGNRWEYRHMGRAPFSGVGKVKKRPQSWPVTLHGAQRSRGAMPLSIWVRRRGPEAQNTAPPTVLKFPPQRRHHRGPGLGAPKNPGPLSTNSILPPETGRSHFLPLGPLQVPGKTCRTNTSHWLALGAPPSHLARCRKVGRMHRDWLSGGPHGAGPYWQEKQAGVGGGQGKVQLRGPQFYTKVQTIGAR